VRVYQFRHFGKLISTVKQPYLLGAGEAAPFALPAGVAAVFDVTPVLAPSGWTGLAAGDAAGEGVVAGASVSSSPTDCNTERCPVMAGSESVRPIRKKQAAAPMVIFASSDCVPRGPKAVLETLLEKSAPASALPGCRSTDTISTMHDKIKSIYKTVIN
jgi:hypothetical protein